jgi:hypothetical protein
VYLVDQGGGNLRLEEVCHAMMDAARVAAGALDEVFRQAAATRQPDLETTLHERGDGLTADEARSSGDEDTSSHGFEPEKT